MRSDLAGRWVALVALLAVGCGSGTNPAARVTPLPSPPPSASAVASPSTAGGVCDAAHRCLALVTLRGSTAYVVRDITDISHPRTVSNLGPIPTPRFVSASEISYRQEDTLLRAPLTGSPKTVAATSAISMVEFAWSPDAKTVAYLANVDESRMELHIVSDGADRMAATMPGLPSVWGCESQQCADSVDLREAYSPDGRFISWAQSLTGVFRMWTTDGTDTTPSGISPSMTVWSGGGLYFQSAQGVKIYHNQKALLFLSGVTWIRPKASPGGGQIVYETRDETGMAHVFVVDTATANVHKLGDGRAEPRYLTSRFIWYRGERACTAADQCQTGTFVDSGKTYIYDLQDGTESESIITGLYDVWPHAA